MQNHDSFISLIDSFNVTFFFLSAFSISICKDGCSRLNVVMIIRFYVRCRRQRTVIFDEWLTDCNFFSEDKQLIFQIEIYHFDNKFFIYFEPNLQKSCVLF